jgi:tetratricopeptide (TPR) repeat protein
MLRQFEQTTDVRVAGNVLMVCVLREDALPDMAQLLPLAQVAGPWGHTGAYALGEALYRAGRYEEAVKSMDEAAKTYRPGVSEWSFLAMSHQRLGHADEARRCLAKAARWIDEANSQKEDDLSGTRPAWGGWHEPVVYPLLFREAEELLNNESGALDQK